MLQYLLVIIRFVLVQVYIRNGLAPHLFRLPVEPRVVMELCLMHHSLNLFILKHDCVFNIPQGMWKKIFNIWFFLKKNQHLYYIVLMRFPSSEWWLGSISTKFCKTNIVICLSDSGTLGAKSPDIALKTIMSMERCNENGLLKGYKESPKPYRTTVQCTSSNSLGDALSACIAFSLYSSIW